MRHVGIIVVGMGLALLVSGCIYPHVANESPAVTGRIVDAKTHQPIPGVTVSWLTKSGRKAITDASGNFSLKSGYGMHWMIINSCAAELPLYQEFRQLKISRPGYDSSIVYPSIYAKEPTEPDAPKLALSDLSLTPHQPEQ